MTRPGRCGDAHSWRYNLRQDLTPARGACPRHLPAASPAPRVPPDRERGIDVARETATSRPPPRFSRARASAARQAGSAPPELHHTQMFADGCGLRGGHGCDALWRYGTRCSRGRYLCTGRTRASRVCLSEGAPAPFLRSMSHTPHDAACGISCAVSTAC